MNEWAWRIVLAALAVGVAGALASCMGGDDDDAGEEDGCAAEMVAGFYSVRITVEADDCDEANVGAQTTGQLHVVQGLDGEVPKTNAEVYFAATGSQEEVLLFAGTVCGLQIVGNVTRQDTFGELDCTASTFSSYTLVVDDTASPRTISGSFSETTTWSGQQCPAGIETGTECSVSKSVVPLE